MGRKKRLNQHQGGGLGGGYLSEAVVDGGSSLIEKKHHPGHRSGTASGVNNKTLSTYGIQ